MKQSATKGTRRTFVVLGAAAVVTASFLAAYVAIRTPSPEQACIRACAQQGKSGKLAYHGPAAPKPGPVKDALFSECECQ